MDFDLTKSIKSAEGKKSASAPSSSVVESEPQKSSQTREFFLKAVSAEMRKARERADLTVSDLHRATGISRTVLQGYEAGRFVPGAHELMRLCQVLKVTPNQIIFGEELPLEKKPLLAAFVGDVQKATGTAKLAVVLQVLSKEELTSLLSLVESIVISRVGGAAKLKMMFEAVEVAVGSEKTPGLLEEFGEEFFKSLTPEQLEKLRLISEKKFPEKGKKPSSK